MNLNKQSLSHNAERGFTLIELLVVIAVLGVLATVVIVAINPLQQLARARDVGRLSTVTQLGQALATYATANNSTFPTANATWVTTLVNAGEVQAIPSAPAYGGGIVACATNAQPASGFCYKLNVASTGPAIVYSALESLVNSSKCVAPATPWAVYSTIDGKAGIVCNNGEPAAPAAAGTLVFVP